MHLGSGSCKPSGSYVFSKHTGMGRHISTRDDWEVPYWHTGSVGAHHLSTPFPRADIKRGVHHPSTAKSNSFLLVPVTTPIEVHKILCGLIFAVGTPNLMPVGIYLSV